jgi:aminopeptidase
MDQRTQKLAKLVVNYTLKVKKGENVIVSGGIEAQEFVEALYKEILLLGAYPILNIGLPNLSPFFFKYATDEQLKHFPKTWDYTVHQAQKFIGIDSEYNTKEFSSVDPKKLALRSKITHSISDYICNERAKIWRCSVGYPSVSQAQDADMSLEEYEDFVFGACLQDWDKLGRQIKKILSKIKKGKHVHLLGKNVDLKMDIHGDKALDDLTGDNMPSGEVFMAPKKYSLEGWIKFEYPAVYFGNEVDGIFLRFKKGKIVEATANRNEKFLKAMIAIDDNASYIGELGIGCNPKIKKYTKSILYDEKIIGTIHLAIGMAYKENGGGNDSDIHWDIIKDMRDSRIILDGKIIQKNGKWQI